MHAQVITEIGTSVYSIVLKRSVCWIH